VVSQRETKLGLNDFAARFAIASDEDKVAEFVAHLTAEIQRLDAELAEVYAKYSVAQEEANRIQPGFPF
jgi:histidinol-phosphate/aromatic aminotransferase/cobyric acid decarboxylase-like protein